MKANNESGITLLILVISVILMLIISVISIGAFQPEIYNKILSVNENSEKVRTEQDKEAQNAIEGLGGIQ